MPIAKRYSLIPAICSLPRAPKELGLSNLFAEFHKNPQKGGLFVMKRLFLFIRSSVKRRFRNVVVRLIFQI